MGGDRQTGRPQCPYTLLETEEGKAGKLLEVPTALQSTLPYCFGRWGRVWRRQKECYLFAKISSQSLAQPNCGRRFALPQRGWGDPSHHHVEAIGFVYQLVADGDQNLTQCSVSERTASHTREGAREGMERETRVLHRKFKKSIFFLTGGGRLKRILTKLWREMLDEMIWLRHVDRREGAAVCAAPSISTPSTTNAELQSSCI